MKPHAETKTEEQEAVFTDSYGDNFHEGSYTGPDIVYKKKLRDLLDGGINDQRRLVTESERGDYLGELRRMEHTRKELSQLADPKKVERLVENSAQYQVAYGVSEIVGAVRVNSPLEVGYESDQEVDRTHKEARGLFQDACAKIYPHIAEDVEGRSISINAQLLIKRVGEIDLSAYTPPDRSLGNSLRASIFKGGGVEVAKVLKKIEFDLQEAVHENAHDNLSYLYEAVDGTYDPSMDKKLNIANEHLYRLGLIIDKLDNELYGQDTPPDEREEIDGIRNNINGGGDQGESQENISEEDSGAVLAENGEPTADVDTNRETKEVEKKLMREIMDNGAANIYTSLPSTKNKRPKSSRGERGGYSSLLGDEDFKNGKFENNRAAAVREVFGGALLESINTQSGNRGKPFEHINEFFGIEELSYKQHSDVVNNGKDEPAYELVYLVCQSADDKKIPFQDDIGRPGNSLEFSMTLPESIAKKAMQRAKEDPKFVRRLLREAVAEKMEIPQERWGVGGSGENNGDIITPPYEGWAENKGGSTQMYIYDGDVDKQGFQEGLVHDVPGGGNWE